MRGRKTKLQWLNRHNLTTASCPIDWMMAMLIKCGGQQNRKKKTIFSNWVSWSAAKGFLVDCSQKDGTYSFWKSFPVTEIKIFVGLFILNGISISPRLDWKFKKKQNEVPANGSDLWCAAFRKDAENRLKQSRSLSDVQDPLLRGPAHYYLQ